MGRAGRECRADGTAGVALRAASPGLERGWARRIAGIPHPRTGSQPRSQSGSFIRATNARCASSSAAVGSIGRGARAPDRV